MTSERDFDRLARAWLELGPDEAPDRVVAAVLQAAETTPQVRRPMRWPTWRSSQVTRLFLAAGAAAVLVVAIGGGFLLSQRNQPVIGGPAPSPSVAPSPSAAPSPSVVASPPPSATPSVAIVLQRAPSNLGCDSIGIDYDMATIRIDPAAAAQVWAEANDGTRLATYWSAGFSATYSTVGYSATEKRPTIVGPEGIPVAQDGTLIYLDRALWDATYLCPSPDALYILEQAPR